MRSILAIAVLGLALGTAPVALAQHHGGGGGPGGGGMGPSHGPGGFGPGHNDWHGGDHRGFGPRGFDHDRGWHGDGGWGGGGWRNHHHFRHFRFFAPGIGYGYCDDPELWGTRWWLEFCTDQWLD